MNIKRRQLPPLRAEKAIYDKFKLVMNLLAYAHPEHAGNFSEQDTKECYRKFRRTVKRMNEDGRL